jgi:hypothetical protein
LSLKLSCDSHFQRAFAACVCVFKEITLVSSSQRNYFENATAWNKRTLKTIVATQLYLTTQICFDFEFWVDIFSTFFHLLDCLTGNHFNESDKQLIKTLREKKMNVNVLICR